MVARRRVLIGALGACALAGCAAAARAPAPAVAPTALRLIEPPPASERFSDPARRARLAATFPRLDAFLAREAAARHLPSLAFGVVIDGELAFERGYGARDAGGKSAVDADTVYRIGSITKTFTALAILALRDEGKLSLDEPAARYLPELAALRYPTRDAPPITLRHLLTHASGLPRLGPFSYAQSDHDVTEAELLRGLPDVALLAAPGTQTRYSNFGFALLGVVVTRVSGERYRDYVTGAILDPLGMSSTRWSEGDVPSGRLATAYQRGPGGLVPVAHWRLGASEAAGGLYSSVRDLARYVAFQLAAYPPRDDDDRGPLRRSSLREAHGVQRAGALSIKRREPEAGGAPPIDARAEGTGLAWASAATCAFEQVVGHDGGTEGYSSIVRFLPQRGVGLVALTNLESADLGPVADGALGILNASGALARREIAPSPALARAVAGAVALYDDFQPATYAELFAPSFRAALPEAAVVATIEKLKAVHGRCDSAAATNAKLETPNAGAFLVPCASGALELHVSVNTAGKIDETEVESRSAPATSPRDLCTPR